MSMPLAVFKPKPTVFERARAVPALDRVATAIGSIITLVALKDIADISNM
jgi:hypothetical protein